MVLIEVTIILQSYVKGTVCERIARKINKKVEYNLFNSEQNCMFAKI